MKLLNFLVIYVLLKFMFNNSVKSNETEERKSQRINESHDNEEKTHQQVLQKCQKKIGEILLIRKDANNLISDNKFILLNADVNGLILVDSNKQSLIKRITFDEIIDVSDKVTTKTKDFPIQNCFKTSIRNKAKSGDIFMCARNDVEKSTWINSIKELKKCNGKPTSSDTNYNGK